MTAPLFAQPAAMSGEANAADAKQIRQITREMDTVATPEADELTPPYGAAVKKL